MIYAQYTIAYARYQTGQAYQYQMFGALLEKVWTVIEGIWDIHHNPCGAFKRQIITPWKAHGQHADMLVMELFARFNMSAGPLLRFIRTTPDLNLVFFNVPELAVAHDLKFLSNC